MHGWASLIDRDAEQALARHGGEEALLDSINSRQKSCSQSRLWDSWTHKKLQSG